jgi:hypothetical protein
MAHIQSLDKISKVTGQQIIDKTEELIAQALAMKKELLEKLERSVSTLKKILESTKLNLEMQFANSERLALWSNAILTGGPAHGAEITKDLMDQLKKLSEAEHTSPPVSVPLFTPSTYKIADTNTLGVLHTKEIR